MIGHRGGKDNEGWQKYKEGERGEKAASKAENRQMAVKSQK
jgi:hypothetical protein